MVGGQEVLTKAEAGSVVIVDTTGGEVGGEDEVDHTAVPDAASGEVGVHTDRGEVDPGGRDLNLEYGDHQEHSRGTTGVGNNKEQEIHHEVGRKLTLLALMSLPPSKIR